MGDGFTVERVYRLIEKGLPWMLLDVLVIEGFTKITDELAKNNAFSFGADIIQDEKRKSWIKTFEKSEHIPGRKIIVQTSYEKTPDSSAIYQVVHSDFSAVFQTIENGQKKIIFGPIQCPETNLGSAYLLSPTIAVQADGEIWVRNWHRTIRYASDKNESILNKVTCNLVDTYNPVNTNSIEENTSNLVIQLSYAGGTKPLSMDKRARLTTPFESKVHYDDKGVKLTEEEINALQPGTKNMTLCRMSENVQLSLVNNQIQFGDTGQVVQKLEYLVKS